MSLCQAGSAFYIQNFNMYRFNCCNIVQLLFILIIIISTQTNRLINITSCLQFQEVLYGDDADSTLGDDEQVEQASDESSVSFSLIPIFLYIYK